jgi:hypothetical protein
MDNKEEWTGTAGELWHTLDGLVGDGIKHTKAWPGAPNALSARLKRLAPVLRGIGIEYEDVRLPGSARRRVKRLRKNRGAKDRFHRSDRLGEEERPAKPENHLGTMVSGVGGSRAEDAQDIVPEESPANGRIQSGSDDGNDDLQALSVPAPFGSANPGVIEQCAHGYLEGKGCFLCDTNHPYRLEHGGAA